MQTTVEREHKPEPKRPLHTIAADVRKDWKRVSPHAEPYLAAMETLTSIREDYYYDSAESVVLYFLSNATGWRGETARAIKKELGEHLASLRGRLRLRRSDASRM